MMKWLRRSVYALSILATSNLVAAACLLPWAAPGKEVLLWPLSFLALVLLVISLLRPIKVQALPTRRIQRWRRARNF